MHYLAFSITAKKALNFVRRKAFYFLSRRVNIDDKLTELSKKPGGLCFEAANICNASCIFCAYQYLKRPKTILTMDLFKKAIDEFGALGGGGIAFNPIVGESLVDPSLIEKIIYARSKKNINYTGFFTNGILINKIGSRQIITSGINGLTVSIGGFDSESYSRTFRVDCWDSVYKGIQGLLKENELCGNKVKIRIGLRSDIPLSKILNSPDFKRIRKYRFDLEFQIHYDNWSKKIKADDLRGVMRLKNVPKKKLEACFQLYASPTILSNGDMTLCGCRDVDGELVLGNIGHKSILEMWRDPRVEEIRRGFYLQRYPKVCEDCSSYNSLSVLREEKIYNVFIRKYFNNE